MAYAADTVASTSANLLSTYSQISIEKMLSCQIQGFAESQLSDSIVLLGSRLGSGLWMLTSY